MDHMGHHTNDAATEPVDVPSFSTDTQPFPTHEPSTTQGADSGDESTGQRRLRLLEAVQRGEMTVDEALAQLDGDTSDN
jgi:hypothetical protein